MAENDDDPSWEEIAAQLLGFLAALSLYTWVLYLMGMTR